VHRPAGAVLFAVVSLVLVSALAAAENITQNLHVNLQFTNASGQIENGTWNLTFNLSRNNNCSDIVWTNSTDVTADTRGIVSVDLQNITGNFSEQLWLCYERNGTLKANHRLARVPYAFQAANVSAAGVRDDATLNISSHNFSANMTWLDALFVLSWLSPLADALLDLGNSTTRFRDLYISRNLTDGSRFITVQNLSDAANVTLDYARINATVGLNATLPPGGVNYTHLSNFTNDRNFTNISAIPGDLTLRNLSNAITNFTNISAISTDLQLANGTVTDPAGLYQNASTQLTANWFAGNFSILISGLVLNNTGNALALINATGPNGSFVVDHRGNVNASGNISGTIGNFTGAVVAGNLTDNIYHILVRNITEAVTYMLNVTRAGLVQNGTGNLSFSQLQMAVNYTTNLSALVNRTNWTANVTNATFYVENVTQVGLWRNASSGGNLSLGRVQAAINYSEQLRNLTDITNLTNGTTHLVSYGNLTGGPPNFTEGFNATEARGLDALNFSNNISVGVKNASCVQFKANETVVDFCK